LTNALARGQLALNVVDREVALAQRHHQLADRIAGGCGVRAGEGAEEGRALLEVVAELVTEDAEGAGGIAEPPSRLGGRELLDEVGAEGFVLAMQRAFGGEEEGGGPGFR
jgi:hypothetical protein